MSGRPIRCSRCGWKAALRKDGTPMDQVCESAQAFEDRRAGVLQPQRCTWGDYWAAPYLDGER